MRRGSCRGGARGRRSSRFPSLFLRLRDCGCQQRSKNDETCCDASVPLEHDTTSCVASNQRRKGRAGFACGFADHLFRIARLKMRKIERRVVRRRLLRASRPRHRGPAEQRDELAALHVWLPSPQSPHRGAAASQIFHSPAQAFFEKNMPPFSSGQRPVTEPMELSALFRASRRHRGATRAVRGRSATP